ncbi:MAG: hypothetical protein V1645_01285, partial [archaeon]
MNNETKKRVVQLYNEEYSIRAISELINKNYGRECIRKELKKVGVILRGRGMVYKNYKDLVSNELQQFAELLGYLYGDGSLSNDKNARQETYRACLTFSLNERDLVLRIVEIT